MGNVIDKAGEMLTTKNVHSILKSLSALPCEHIDGIFQASLSHGIPSFELEGESDDNYPKRSFVNTESKILTRELQMYTSQVSSESVGGACGYLSEEIPTFLSRWEDRIPRTSCVF